MKNGPISKTARKDPHHRWISLEYLKKAISRCEPILPHCIRFRKNDKDGSFLVVDILRVIE
jgi:hypothetical protein